eukprot:TRINITY_DN927_c0_g1_i1.p1 TRINITY_DN927_c0_g1~~TRINITY_DN927_c0_g1_i1.p1  ORF type:complete len:563 (+),score=249.98 TRINITY_DN927_c0_g1_i1:440-2128(+)
MLKAGVGHLKSYFSFDENETPVVFECGACFNRDRTKRGTLYLTKRTLYFLCKMGGSVTKFEIPLNEVTAFNKNISKKEVEIHLASNKYVLDNISGSNFTDLVEQVQKYLPSSKNEEDETPSPSPSPSPSLQPLSPQSSSSSSSSSPSIPSPSSSFSSPGPFSFSSVGSPPSSSSAEVAPLSESTSEETNASYPGLDLSSSSSSTEVSHPSLGPQSSPIPIAQSGQDEDHEGQRENQREESPEIPSESPLAAYPSLSSSEPPFVLDLSSSSDLPPLPDQEPVNEEKKKEKKKKVDEDEEIKDLKDIKGSDEIGKKEIKILEDKKVPDMASSPKDLPPISVSPISSGGSSLKQRTMQMENQRNEAEKERKRKAEQQRKEAEKRSGQVASGASDPKKFLNSLPKDPSSGAKDGKAPKTLEDVVDTLGAFGIHFLGLFVCLLILPGSAFLHWRDLFTSTFLLSSFDLSLFFPLMSLLQPIFVLLLDKYAKQHKAHHNLLSNLVMPMAFRFLCHFVTYFLLYWLISGFFFSGFLGVFFLPIATSLTANYLSYGALVPPSPSSSTTPS